MKSIIKRSASVVVCVALIVVSSVFSIPGKSLTTAEKNKLNSDISKLQKESAQIQREINSIKAKKHDQQAIVNAYQRQIANTQAQIDRCNAEIYSMNAKISANKKKMSDKQAQIDADKLKFQKRIRAIYMSNIDSNVKILLSADNFAESLQASQLTASISAKDKQLMERLAGEIEDLNKLNADNQKIIDSQVSIRATIQKKQDELAAQERAAASVLGGIVSEQNSAQADKNKVDKEIRAKQKQLEDSIQRNSANYAPFINLANNLQWPVNGFRKISAGFQSNDSVHRGHHNGIDIAGSGIQGQPIRAIADGYVTTVSNSCSHNYKKYGNCCGNGYGNYCVINHGKIKGATYVAYYAHAQRIIVGNGAHVKQGQVIGYVGTTGWSTGYHLHLGVLRNGSWINPYPLFF